MKKWAIIWGGIIWLSVFKHTIFEKEIVQKITFPNINQKPKESLKPYPHILFIHGAGDRGTDPQSQRNKGSLKMGNEKYIGIFAILAPQCPENIYWNTDHLVVFIQEMIKKDLQIIPNKIYLTVLSMGSCSAFKLIEEHPKLFTKLVAIFAPINRIIWFKSNKIHAY